MATLDFVMTVEWTKGGKHGAGRSKTVDGDIGMPPGTTTEDIQNYCYEQVTKGEPRGGRIIKFELCGKVLVDVPSYRSC